jgi:DNA-directed RNA polymerase specialized sigma24 family protein
MSKPDPYGDWVLFPADEGQSLNPPAIDDELILAAREVWPRVLVHAKRELNADGLGADSASMAAQVWERMLRSVAKTRQRNTHAQQPIADLQSYLFLAFVHRFNRAVQQEQKHAERIELVSSSIDLERIESAQDCRWVEELERAIAIREIADRMDGWTRKVWQARQFGYTWKEIASWLGISEQQAKMKFQYGLEKTRRSIVRLLKSGKSKGSACGQGDVSSR